MSERGGARVEYFGPGMNYGSQGLPSYLLPSLPPYLPATHHLSLPPARRRDGGHILKREWPLCRENGGGVREQSREHHVRKLELARISLSDFPLRRFSLVSPFLSFSVEDGLNRSTDSTHLLGSSDAQGRADEAPTDGGTDTFVVNRRPRPPP